MRRLLEAMSRMSDELKSNLSRRDTWLRLFYILVLGLIYSVAEIVVIAVVVVQWGFVLFTGRRNARLAPFAAQLSRFCYDLLRYLTYTSDYKPFPFAPWAEHADSAAAGGQSRSESL